jgi:hypothetical protein
LPPGRCEGDKTRLLIYFLCCTDNWCVVESVGSVLLLHGRDLAEAEFGHAGDEIFRFWKLTLMRGPSNLC